MMQFRQQSRWQSWMHMLAVDIRLIGISVPSVRSTRMAVLPDRQTAISGSASMELDCHLFARRRNT